MLNLNDLHLFVQAVECGGFTAAARRLGLPKSTVSKRVAELEAALGARLIHRTSRSFALSDTGRDFFEHARAAVIEAESAESAVRRRLAEPSGSVRLTASVPTARIYLADRLPLIARRLPRVRLDLHVTDRFVDLVQEGFDIAVRSHFAPLPDSGLVQRRMAEDPVILVASPDYVGARGAPATPPGLAGHDGLLTRRAAGTWRLVDDTGRPVVVSPKPRLIADESHVLLRAATASLGIAPLPARMCGGALAAGELVRILPGWTAGAVRTTILMPHRRGQLPSVRAVVDMLLATSEIAV